MSPEAVEKRSITNERDYNEQSRRTQAFIFSSVPFNQMVVVAQGKMFDVICSYIINIQNFNS